jgi:ribosomal protein L7/L12
MTLVLGGESAPVARVLRLERCGPNKIQVIKVIRTYTRLGLKEAKELADAPPCVLATWDDATRLERFRADLVAEGASASVRSANAPPAQPREDSVPVAGEGITLLELGPNKIQVIRVVREYTRLGLKEAKELVESAPCAVGQKLDVLRLQDFVRDLREVGAKAR